MECHTRQCGLFAGTLSYSSRPFPVLKTNSVSLSVRISFNSLYLFTPPFLPPPQTEACTEYEGAPGAGERPLIDVRAPRTVERRAGRTTAPAASCCGVMGGGAAPTTRAACAARARLSAEGHRARRCPSTTAPHRPAAPGRRVASRFDRRRCGRACTDMRRGAWHASGSGKARCARCACRDRPGAPWGSNPNRRLPCGDHLARARALAPALALILTDPSVR